MKAEEYFKEGQLEEALTNLEQTVREKPADSKSRIFFFQLLCVLGQWKRALTQLKVLGGMDEDGAFLAQIYPSVIQCELLRAEIFSGKRTPLIFGDPEEWMGLMVKANQETAMGSLKAGQNIREKALELAPVVEGQINEGDTFAWIADADTRLGPILEAIFERKYYWVPISRIETLTIEEPSDLRDLIWIPATFTWTNRGEIAGFIPSRYPGTEACSESALRLCKKTDWTEKADGLFYGLGQRLLTTDRNDYPLLEIRKIKFHHG